MGKILLAERPDHKIIYASGYSPEPADIDFAPCEGLNYLRKPYQTTQLLQAVRARLGQNEEKRAPLGYEDSNRRRQRHQSQVTASHS
jgi:DNA-binding NtrC family response regulator